MNKDDIIQKIKNHTPVLQPLTKRSAAVMVILLNNENNSFEIVLTKRSETLSDYAGHYSLPGGMLEPQDKDLLHTAMREVEEELNVSKNNYEVIGQLDDMRDRYGNLVRVYVSLMNKADFISQFRFSDAEVAEVYLFAIEKLTQLKDEPALYAITRRRPSYAFTEGQVFVWGLTAAILMNLFYILSDILSDPSIFEL